MALTTDDIAATLVSQFRVYVVTVVARKGGVYGIAQNSEINNRRFGLGGRLLAVAPETSVVSGIR
jgi:hypothetical protein